MANQRNKNLRIALVVLLIISLAINVLQYREFSTVDYEIVDKVAGVTVLSNIPLSDVKNLTNIALYNNPEKAAITCNFELSAISEADKGGYKVFIEKGPKGVYISETSAFIRGQTDEEMLDACHAFACLRDSITCPDSFAEIRNIMHNARQLNLVVDENVQGAGLRGYSELLGVYGFIQAQRADKDGDGTVSQAEVDSNSLYIYPYIREGSFCILQPVNTPIQVLDLSGEETWECKNVESGIFIVKSDVNEIVIEGERIWLKGDDDALHTEAILVRDIISPEWIRIVFGAD